MLQHENILLIAPPWLQIWLFVGIAVNAASILFIWKRPEARWVFLGFIVAGVWMEAHKQLFGHDRLMSLGHLVGWTPFVIYLIVRLPKIDRSGLFGIWINALLLLDSVYLVLDANEVVQYFQGDKYPAWMIGYRHDHPAT